MIQWPLRPDRLRLSARQRQRLDHIISQSEATRRLRNFPLKRFVIFHNVIHLYGISPLFIEARSLLGRIHEEGLLAIKTEFIFTEEDAAQAQVAAARFLEGKQWNETLRQTHFGSARFSASRSRFTSRGS
jgi:hypothetical protein